MDEEKVVELIKTRLERGKVIYGALSLVHDKRDMLQEALEEVLDQAIYTAIRILQLKEMTAESIPHPVDESTDGVVE